MTIGDRVAETLRDAGVSIVFGIDDPQALYAGLRKNGVRPIIVHDERSGAFMADGYSRASRQLSVCTGLGGPGATNLATGLFEAYCASVPVLGIVSEASSMRADVHAFQALPHEAFFAGLTKAVVRLERGGDGRVAATHAINLAVSGRPRPVVLLAPDDYLWADASDAGDPAPETPAIEYPSSRAGASAEAITRAREALRGARRPVILVGGGVNVSGAGDDLVRLAERLEIPYAVSLMGKGAVPETHPLALGVASGYTGGSIGRGAVATQALCDADLVLVVGSDLDAITTSAGLWPSASAQLVRIDNDPTEMISRPGIHVLADAREALRQLGNASADELRRSDPDDGWLEETKGRIAEMRLAIQRYDNNSGDADGEVAPGRVVTELERHLGEGDAIVTDASYSSAWALDRICQDWTGRFVFAPRGSGVLGWGLPASLGVKLARPDGQVVCLTGDGGLCFSLGELETAVRNQLDVTLVVLNNGSFGFQRHSDMARQGADPGDLTFASDVNYADLARAFGWQSTRVSTFGEFADAYPAALADGGPTLIEVLVSRDEIPPISKFDALRQGMPRPAARIAA
jgi:acetolactate synthase-1/2/3 large subunit